MSRLNRGVAYFFVFLGLSGWRQSACFLLVDVEVEWYVSGYMVLTALPWGRWRALFSIHPLYSLLGCCAGLESPPWKPISLTVSPPHILPKSHHTLKGVTSPWHLLMFISLSALVIMIQETSRESATCSAYCTLTYYPQYNSRAHFLLMQQ